MPLRPPNPFADLEDTEYWNRYSIQMRLRSATQKSKYDFFVRHVREVMHMNPFSHHGVTHLSPSAVNMFTGSPSAWIAKALLGHRFSAGPAAWRGIAVEDALVAYAFYNATPEEAIDQAYDKFDKMKGDLAIDDAAQKERDRIPRYVLNTIDAWIELTTNFPVGDVQAPPLGQSQWEVGLPCRFGEHANDRVEVIGYLDFLFARDDGHHVIMDLKTTARIPSEMPEGHALQASFYKRALGKPCDVYFMYTSPKEEGKPNPFHIIKLDDETYQRELKRMKDTIIRMSKLLRLSDDPFVLAEAIPHDESSFYWSGEPSLEQIMNDVKTAIENTEEEK